ncbi:MAG: MASE1 domain-containing protein [Planctomycetaceae bacterium]|nr:MASE1 domain-containing protein [Planctomycetales bacterium]MCB9938785.1 MASE1 domain-containing protein [Planctomycetaceae bacterium]
MKFAERTHLLRWTILQGGLALAYFWTGKLGLELAFMHSHVSPVWPPTGLAMGAILVFGYRVWPAIVLGLFALTMSGVSALPWPAMLAIAFGNAMEAIAGAWCIRTFSGQSNPLFDAKTFLWFLGAGVFVCTTISATIGVASLCVAGAASWETSRQLWWTWWLGDATGALLVTPFVVAVFTSDFRWPPRAKVVEGVIVALTLALICYFVFLDPKATEFRGFSQTLLLMPALAWAAFHFSKLGLSSAVLVVSLVGVWGTANGLGPLAANDANSSLLAAQSSFGLIAGTILLLAALRAQQRRDEKQLRYDQELLRQLIELQEQDRRMVAHDIHDGLMQDLVGAHMLVQSVPIASDAATEDSRVNRIAGLLQKAINEGRRLIREMRPMVLDEQGVIEAIQHLIADFEEHAELVIAFDHDVKFERLEARLEGMIFRMVQESLNNVEKHAKAKYASVRITQDGGQLKIVVRDDGKGFNPAKVSRRRFGLRSIRERARLVGGTVQIESEPGKGTSVIIQLPIVTTLASRSLREESDDSRFD